MFQRLPNSATAADGIPYRILGTQKFTLKGLRTKFSLLRDGELILFSMIRPRSSTVIVHVSREKKDFHLSSSSFEAALLTGNVLSRFRFVCAINSDQNSSLSDSHNQCSIMLPESSE
jgi:hypothetical protein